MTTTRRTATALAALALAAGSSLAANPVADAAPALPTNVGNGWSAVIVGPAKAGTAGNLRLVSPTGQQYSLGNTSADGWLADVSNDGRHVLLGSDGGPNDLSIVDTRTGARTHFHGRFEELRFTNPSGAGMLGRTPTGALRLDTTGRTVVRFAQTGGGNGLLPSKDGLFLVSQNARGSLQVNGNATGALVRTLANPAGFKDCHAQHWSDATHFTATCDPARGGAMQVFRFSIEGGRAVPLTSQLDTRQGLQWGYMDSWRLTNGSQLVTAVSPCGPVRAGVVRGHGVRIFRVGEGAEPMATVANQVYYLNGDGCGGDNHTLTRYDAVTGKQVLLAGGSRTPGLQVREVAVVDDKQ